ncbi:hypothetical protein [Synechococcus sp. CBW1107]|uniref:hypothetical protein n=1 Tax=Synechococcus sp. CBW1107 TaxID=2789857 RepID=UPI002AD3932D|nr:hypothetical protein [Synechococcus sp. CBW1107]
MLSALIKVMLQPAYSIGPGFIDAQVAAVELRVKLAETINQSKTPIGQRYALNPGRRLHHQQVPVSMIGLISPLFSLQARQSCSP